VVLIQEAGLPTCRNMQVVSNCRSDVYNSLTVQVPCNLLFFSECVPLEEFAFEWVVILLFRI